MFQWLDCPHPWPMATSGQHLNRRLLLRSLTGSERRGTLPSSAAPGLVPSPRHPGRRCLLLASLTGRGRRPISRHRRPALCRCPVVSADVSPRPVSPYHATMTCSFHVKIFEWSKCSWRRSHRYEWSSS